MGSSLWVVLVVLGLPPTVTPMVHTLRYFHTFSSGASNFPEFVSVGYVNGLQITNYDSQTQKYVPKQPWMEKITEVDPKYWEKQTAISRGNEHTERISIESAKLRLNVTEGVHFWQNMYGCDWDDETGEIKGYDQYAFDGEDFISLDWDTQTFVAAKQQAFATKRYWERIGYPAHQKHYILHECVKYLKIHVRHGESVLNRKVLPQIYLLQKSLSSTVTCFATGFFPDRAMLFWAKDGEELEETWEIRPNEDGTFQSSVDLDLSSVPSEDWSRYSCVFQLAGVSDEIITKLDMSKILTNERKSLLIFFAVGLIFSIIFTAALALVLYWRRRVSAKQLPNYALRPQEKKPMTSEGDDLQREEEP